MQVEVRERAIRERVDLINEARQAQVLLVEAVGVGDDGAAFLELVEVGFERGGVHHHQHIALVTGREDLHAAEVELVAADAGEGALRGTDLRREIRESADVVAEQRVGVGELGAGELDAITGIAGEKDHDVLPLLYGLGLDGCLHGKAPQRYAQGLGVS